MITQDAYGKKSLASNPCSSPSPFLIAGIPAYAVSKDGTADNKDAIYLIQRWCRTENSNNCTTLNNQRITGSANSLSLQLKQVS